jgi:hypothetical protein
LELLFVIFFSAWKDNSSRLFLTRSEPATEKQEMTGKIFSPRRREAHEGTEIPVMREFGCRSIAQVIRADLFACKGAKAQRQIG